LYHLVKQETMEIVIAIVAFLAGGGLAWVLIYTALKSRSRKIIREAEVEAEVIKKDKILQAKEKFLQLKSEHEKEITARNSKIVSAESKLKQKESTFSQKMEELQRK
jgi:ribonuclease Y